MKIDRTQYDAAICMADTRNPGRFGVELTIGGNPYAVRTASSLDEHSHIIQATALLTGLALLRQKKLNRSRVLVTSDQGPFLRALHEDALDRLSIPSAMADRLKSELREVNASFVFNAEPRYIMSLENWLYHLPLGVLGDLQGFMQQQTAA